MLSGIKLGILAFDKIWDEPSLFSHNKFLKPDFPLRLLEKKYNKKKFSSGKRHYFVSLLRVLHAIAR